MFKTALFLAITSVRSIAASSEPVGQPVEAAVTALRCADRMLSTRDPALRDGAHLHQSN